jgi:hypothetical protein
MKRKATVNGSFAKWRVEEVFVDSVFNLTFVASRQVEVPNPPIHKSSKSLAVRQRRPLHKKNLTIK